MRQLSIPTNKGLKTVMTEHIIRIEASSNYSKIYFSNEYPLTVSKLLHWFEENLPFDYFYRIHRAHIVNRLFISEISCDSKVKLTTGEQLQISRRKKGVVNQMTGLRA